MTSGTVGDGTTLEDAGALPYRGRDRVGGRCSGTLCLLEHGAGAREAADSYTISAVDLIRSLVCRLTEDALTTGAADADTCPCTIAWTRAAAVEHLLI